MARSGVKTNQISAFIIEGYQGWGAIFYPKDYVKAMKKWVKNDALVIVDEIGRIWSNRKIICLPAL